MGCGGARGDVGEVHLEVVARGDPVRLADRPARDPDEATGRELGGPGPAQPEEPADRGVDATMAAMALSGMVSRLAQDASNLSHDVPLDDLVDTATRMWTNALGLTTPELRND